MKTQLETLKGRLDEHVQKRRSHAIQTLDPDICHGKPCVRHLRCPVEVRIDLISAGMDRDEILADHPELERDDILACLGYARLLVSGESLRRVA